MPDHQYHPIYLVPVLLRDSTIILVLPLALILLFLTSKRSSLFCYATQCNVMPQTFSFFHTKMSQHALSQHSPSSIFVWFTRFTGFISFTWFTRYTKITSYTRITSFTGFVSLNRFHKRSLASVGLLLLQKYKTSFSITKSSFGFHGSLGSLHSFTSFSGFMNSLVCHMSEETHGSTSLYVLALKAMI